MAHELPLTHDINDRMQQELYNGEHCVDALVSLVARNDLTLHQVAVDLAGFEEDPIIRLMRLHDLLEQNGTPARLQAVDESRMSTVAGWCVSSYVSAQNCWRTAAPKDPWARRVFGLGAGLFAAGVAKFGVDGLAATPEPKTSTVVLWLAGIIAIGVAKENELG